MTLCEDKTGRYKTGAQARRALEAIRKRSPRDPETDKKPKSTYYCELCRHFHLTSQMGG